MPRDYYEQLGVAKSASQDEIKKAFRKKAHELHPDKGGDAAQFKQINEAYQVLGDDKKRAQYDQFGHAAFTQQAGFGGQGAGGFGGFEGVNINMNDFGDLGDVLGDMFGFGGGGGRGRGGSSRGHDVEVTIRLDFLEAVHGVEKEISLRVLGSCADCKGSGAVGGKTITCSVCRGQGRVTRAQRTPFGTIQTAVACTECGGRGNKPETRCPSCNGAGVKPENRTLSVRIPAGISDGESIRLSGQGEAAGRGGSAGDAYVHMRVGAHPRFRRSGNDVLSEELVPFSLLTLGGTISTETVDGKGDLRIPTGTSAGTVFKLRGVGIPFLHGRGRGDHLVTVVPDVPKKLTKEQKRLLEELKRENL